jgi:hypothetical protein
MKKKSLLPNIIRYVITHVDRVSGKRVPTFSDPEMNFHESMLAAESQLVEMAEAGRLEVIADAVPTSFSIRKVSCGTSGQMFPDQWIENRSLEALEQCREEIEAVIDRAQAEEYVLRCMWSLRKDHR